MSVDEWSIICVAACKLYETYCSRKVWYESCNNDSSGEKKCEVCDSDYEVTTTSTEAIFQVFLHKEIESIPVY